jgi:hypothetical protein
MNEIIQLTKTILHSSSNNISSIAVLVKRELITQELDKIESNFDIKLTV